MCIRDRREGKENDVQAVIGQVYGRTADIKDASIFAISPGMIPGYGMGLSLIHIYFFIRLP